MKELPNIIALAYLGDAVYELHIREKLLSYNIVFVNQLQKASITYVSAKSQAESMRKLLNSAILSDEEKDITFRARNNKRKIHPRNVDIVTYKYSTAFEALIGYLYLTNKPRLNEIYSFLERE
ncbi:MAG: ribonuclease III domain-containing protein [bacterium]|nr:ribonuclease III domain-containing protein [bacterium]